MVKNYFANNVIFSIKYFLTIFIFIFLFYDGNALSRELPDIEIKDENVKKRLIPDEIGILNLEKGGVSDSIWNNYAYLDIVSIISAFTPKSPNRSYRNLINKIVLSTINLDKYKDDNANNKSGFDNEILFSKMKYLYESNNYEALKSMYYLIPDKNSNRYDKYLLEAALITYDNALICFLARKNEEKINSSLWQKSGIICDIINGDIKLLKDKLALLKNIKNNNDIQFIYSLSFFVNGSKVNRLYPKDPFIFWLMVNYKVNPTVREINKLDDMIKFGLFNYDKVDNLIKVVLAEDLYYKGIINLVELTETYSNLDNNFKFNEKYWDDLVRDYNLDYYKGEKKNKARLNRLELLIDKEIFAVDNNAEKLLDNKYEKTARHIYKLKEEFKKSHKRAISYKILYDIAFSVKKNHENMMTFINTISSITTENMFMKEKLLVVHFISEVIDLMKIDNFEIINNFTYKNKLKILNILYAGNKIRKANAFMKKILNVEIIPYKKLQIPRNKLGLINIGPSNSFEIKEEELYVHYINEILRIKGQNKEISKEYLRQSLYFSFLFGYHIYSEVYKTFRFKTGEGISYPDRKDITGYDALGISSYGEVNGIGNISKLMAKDKLNYKELGIVVLTLKKHRLYNFARSIMYEQALNYAW